MNGQLSWLNIVVLVVLMAPTIVEYVVYTALRSATRVRRYINAYRAGEPIPSAWEPEPKAKG